MGVGQVARIQIPAGTQTGSLVLRSLALNEEAVLESLAITNSSVVAIAWIVWPQSWAARSGLFLQRFSRILIK